jgi:hypothetical protein
MRWERNTAEKTEGEGGTKNITVLKNGDEVAILNSRRGRKVGGSE